MSSSSVLIAGCGYLGTHIAQSFLSRGAQVFGLRRSAGGPRAVRLPDGVVQVLASLTRPETLRPLPPVDTVVLCQAPGPNDDYSQTYLEGTQNLLAALHEGGTAPAILFVSSTSVYSTVDGSWVDEQSDPRKPGYSEPEAHEHAEALLGAEEAVLTSGFPAKVVRSTGIYGPYRNRLQAILSGTFVPALSDEVVNRIRVEDLAAAVLTVLAKGLAGEIYIASDNQPTTHREFYEWLYAQMKLPLPAGTDSMKRHSGNKRCRNAKLQSLGWKPQFETYREGYAPLLAAIR